MRIVNFLLAVMFLLFAFVQINDPDPVIWILIYGAMAAVCIMAIFDFYPKIFMLALAVAYLGYSMFDLPSVLQWLRQDNKSDLFDEIAKMENVYIEETREFLGLMICIVVLVFYLFRARRFVSR